MCRAAAGCSVVLLLVVLLAGCVAGSDSDDRRAVARTAARQYFEAVTSDAGDFGWSLLDDASQSQWADLETYARAVESADWGGFEVRVSETIRCDEGYACRVCLDVTDPDAIPDVVRSSDNRAYDGIIIVNEPRECGEGVIAVTLDPFTGMLDGVGVGP